MAQDTGTKKGIETWLQVGILLIGVVTVLATVYFSVRSERTKEITVKYLAKRPLLTLERGRPSAALEVRLGGSRIEAPWLLSGRLENSGNQPIEERDIEVSTKLSFSKGKVVRADIIQKNPQATFGQATAVGNLVTIEHKLLNPGDWINFDVLFDGEPDIPLAFARISGISQVKQLVISSEPARTYTAIVQLPTPVVYLLLIVGSLIGIGSTVGGFGVLGSTTLSAFKQTSVESEERKFKGLDPPTVLRQLTAQTRDARVVFAALGEPVKLEWLDDPQAFSGVINARVAMPILQSLNLNAENATALLVQELKDNLKERLATQVYLSLPSGIDRAVREEMKKIDAQSMSAAELFARARELSTKTAGTKPRFDTDNLVGGVVLLAIGLTLVILLGGTWRTLLGV